MAGEIKISALPLAGAAADADVTAGVQSGTTIKQTNSALYTYMASKIAASSDKYLSVDNYATDNLLSAPNFTALKTETDNHISNLSNPHETTLAQVAPGVSWDGSTMTVSPATALSAVNITTTVTGVSNFALSEVNRGDQTNGLCGYQFETAGTAKWLNGMYPGSAFLTANADDLIFRSFSGSQVVMSLGQTSFDVTITAGNLLIGNASKTINIPSIAASTLVATDGTSNLIAASGTYNISISGNAASASDANSVFSNVIGASNFEYYPIFVQNVSNAYQILGLSSIYHFNPDTGNLTASSFTGSLIGNAATVTNGLYTTGGTMTGDLILDGDPTVNLQAATKQYVDNAVANIGSYVVVAATFNNNPFTYSNGTAGVGATLTSTNGGLYVVDGLNVVLNSRYLIKNQSSDFQNGIYVCTVPGSGGIGGVHAVFTRASDYDTPSQITVGDLVTVTGGSTQSGTTWVQTQVVNTIGTDSIDFSESSVGTTTLTGDVTGTGIGTVATTISNLAVTNAKIANSTIDLTAKVTGTLPFANGGLGFSTATLGDLFYASATNTPGKLSDVATGQVLTSGGVGAAPAYSASPSLTGLTLSGLTANGVVYANGSKALTSNSTLTYDGAATLAMANSNAGNSEVISVSNTDNTNASSHAVLRAIVGGTSGGSPYTRYTITGLGDWYAGLVASSGIYVIGNSIVPGSADKFQINATNDIVSTSGNFIVNTVNKGIEIKAAAVSAGTANAAFVSNVVLTAGASGTISNSFVTTACAGFASVSTAGGTPGLGYRVTCNAGSFVVTSTNALDTSTLNVCFIKGI